MRLQVISYDERQDCHRCRLDDGSLVWLDIMVDGGFRGRTPQSLVGKTLVCDYTHPYIAIASNVREEAAQS